jgi:hypothetical protein
MFRNLRLKLQPEKVTIDAGNLSGPWLAENAYLPITLAQINRLPGNTKRRLYRSLIPPSLLTQFEIDPITWKGPLGDGYVLLKAEDGKGITWISVRIPPEDSGEFFCLEIADNPFNGVDLNLLLLNDPHSECFGIDFDDAGQPTLFGTLRRNLKEELRAKQSGLAPGQKRSSLGASRLALEKLESFLAALGHRAYFLEPLTYASAWIFERRGFAYVRGHKLMDDIHREFQPGGMLYQSLDGSNPFRQPEQWRSVRGRAWAIHDGILESLGNRWDKLRMVKQVGEHAGVNTFPGAIY